MRFGLYIVALIGCLLALPALWGVVDEVRFATSARVLPGEFAYYSSQWSTGETSVGAIAQGPSRASAGSRGSSAVTSSEALYPVFRVAIEDGAETEIQGDEVHAFRYLEPGDSIEVLVNRDPDLAPRIRSPVVRFADDVMFLVLGSVLAGVAGVALRRAPPDDSVRAARPYVIGLVVFVVVFGAIGVIGGILSGEFTWEQLLQNRTE